MRVGVLSYNVGGLRGDRAAMVQVVRAAGPDIVVVQGGPRRLRWRTRSADLANRFGLLYGGGGLSSLGNLVLVSMRVTVRETWSVQFPLVPGRLLRGAVLARCVVGETPFVVVGSHLTTDPEQRPVQAAILAKVLSDVDDPVVLAVDLNDAPDSVAGRTLADGRVSVPARATLICVDPRVDVSEHGVLDSPEARRASVHLPIMAQLRLSPPAAMVSAWRSH